MFSRAGGGLEGLSLAPRSLAAPAAPHPQQRSPHPHRPPPTCRLSRFFQSRAEGPGGSGRLGHPEGFCSSGSPAPAPVLPLLRALARFLLAELVWLGANLPSSPPGVLAATSPARPSVRPPPVTCASTREPGNPPSLPPPPHATPKSGPTGSGDPLPRGTQTQCRLETRTEIGGSYHLQGGTGKSAGSKHRGGELRGLACGPRPGATGRESLWPRSRPRPAPLGGAPRALLPPPPALRSGTVRSPPSEWDPAPT